MGEALPGWGEEAFKMGADTHPAAKGHCGAKEWKGKL